jgi:xanthine dehydrogenase molybdopterin-binding subunit B
MPPPHIELRRVFAAILRALRRAAKKACARLFALDYGRRQDRSLGWAALEELRYDEAGSLLTDSLSTYKLPDLRFLPETTIEFLEGAPNPKAVMRSKAIGEPPFLYGIAGYFAVLEALRAAESPIGAARAARAGAASGAASDYNLPMTPEKALDRITGGCPC